MQGFGFRIPSSVKKAKQLRNAREYKKSRKIPNFIVQKILKNKLIAEDLLIHGNTVGFHPQTPKVSLTTLHKVTVFRCESERANDPSHAVFVYKSCWNNICSEKLPTVVFVISV